MQNIYKKLGFAIVGLLTIGAIINQAQGTWYTACGLNNNDNNTGYSLSSCGQSPELVSHLARCSINSGSINISKEECDSLAFLYDETDGSHRYNSTNWFLSTNISNWGGSHGTGNAAITISGGHIIQLDLQNNGLNGIIYNGLSNLYYLNLLNLEFNNIYGTINMSNSTGLTKLYLDYNAGISNISVANTNTIVDLGLSSTSISNFDPTAYSNLSILDLSDTDSTYINLSGLHLRWADLSNNALTGVEGLAYTHIGYYLDVSNQTGRGLTDLDITNFTDSATINASTAGIQHLTVSSSPYTNANSFNFDYNNLCDLPGNSTGTDYGDNGTGELPSTGNVRDFLDAYAGSLRSSHQYCQVNNLQAQQYYRDAYISWDDPVTMTGSIVGYTIEGASTSGTTYLASNQRNYTFSGNFLLTGVDYDFRVCAAYSSNIGTIYVCDTTSKTLIDPSYFLTEITPIPSYITGLTGFFQFSAVGTGIADPIATPCGLGASMLVSDSSGGVYDVTIEGLQEGNTYSCSIALRSIDISGSIYSNRLPIGPFTVDMHTESPTIMSPIQSSSHVRTQSMPISFVLPEMPMHNSLYLSFIPQTIGQQTINLQLDDANPFIVNTFSIVPAGNLLAVQEVISGNANSIPNGIYTVTLSYKDVAGNPTVSTSVASVSIINSNSGGGGGGGSLSKDICTEEQSSNYYDRTCGSLTNGWKKLFARFGSGATSSVSGDVITVKAFVSDVFKLLHITKPIHRQADSDTKVVPEQLVTKVIKILRRILNK